MSEETFSDLVDASLGFIPDLYYQQEACHERISYVAFPFLVEPVFIFQ